MQVAERGEYRYPWVNLVDLRIAKSFRSGSMRFEPTLDLFNVFNNNAVTNAVQTVGHVTRPPVGDRHGTAAPARRPDHVLDCRLDCRWAAMDVAPLTLEDSSCADRA